MYLFCKNYSLKKVTYLQVRFNKTKFRETSVAPWCSGYHYCTTSINKSLSVGSARGKFEPLPLSPPFHENLENPTLCPSLNITLVPLVPLYSRWREIVLCWVGFKANKRFHAFPDKPPEYTHRCEHPSLDCSIIWALSWSMLEKNVQLSLSVISR